MKNMIKLSMFILIQFRMFLQDNIVKKGGLGIPEYCIHRRLRSDRRRKGALALRGTFACLVNSTFRLTFYPANRDKAASD